jgi:hypothetical protein
LRQGTWVRVVEEKEGSTMIYKRSWKDLYSQSIPWSAQHGIDNPQMLVTDTGYLHICSTLLTKVLLVFNGRQRHIFCFAGATNENVGHTFL